MSEPLTLKLQTLTPLWTGGVDGTMDRVHETGLIGSLRWWYEAVVCGLGGRACDPTEHSCIYERKPDESHEQAYARLCDACQLFGATGWRRRFKLQVSAQDAPAWEGEHGLNVRPYGRTRGWFLNPGRVGALTVTLTGDPETLAQLAALFRFLEQWGSVGARPQLGYGVFWIDDMTGEPPLQMWDTMGSEPIGALPDLRSFALFKLQFMPREDRWWTQVSGLRELRGRREWSIIERLADQGMAPVMPAIKNYLRYEQQWSSNALPHWLFGTLRGDERVRSKVALSWAYRQPDGRTWEIRGWVQLPNDARGRANRAEVTRVLEQALARPQNWQQALGLSSGFQDAALTWAPTASPWQIHDAQTVADFMNTLQPEVIR